MPRNKPVSSAFDSTDDKTLTDEEKYPHTRNWTNEQKEACLKRYEGFLWGLVNSIRTIPDAAISREDLLQDARIAFLHAMDLYDPSQKVLFTTYAYKAVKNTFKMRIRNLSADKRKVEKPLLPYYSDTDTASDSEVLGAEDRSDSISLSGSIRISVEDETIQNEILRAIYQILSREYNPMEQEIFLSLAQKNKTQNELAHEFGCSQAKISMIFRGTHISLLERLSHMGFTELN